jgi:hypothetical protein
MLGNFLTVEGLQRRLLHADTITQSLFFAVTRQARSMHARASEKMARISQLVQAQAWTEASLALVEFTLPGWCVRRLTFQNDEWRCELTRATITFEVFVRIT